MAQIAPVWLNKSETLKKIESSIIEASKEKAELIVFGEALLPGYPFWLGLTNGAEFNSSLQKELHAHYIRNSVQIESIVSGSQRDRLGRGGGRPSPQQSAHSRNDPIDPGRSLPRNGGRSAIPGPHDRDLAALPTEQRSGRARLSQGYP